MNRKAGKSLDTDTGRYNKYVKPVFGDKEPKAIIKLDVDRVRLKLLKKLSPQSVKHVLNLFTWIVNYGTKNNLCQGVSFHIQKPSVNNEKTEDLTPEELERLLLSIEEDSNIDVGRIMKVALFTGMRRMEILRLKWKDLNFEAGFISIRGPKGGEDQKIPMNETAREIFKSVVKTGSEYIFPGRGGGQRTTIGRIGQRITKRAGLPKGFRPLHGLRHVYASMLASSGKVDMYVLQRLMTHKSPKMTQRYAHLRDEALKDGAGQIDEIMKQSSARLSPITNHSVCGSQNNHN
ncbi:Phage integrase family protein [Desulfocicer vacuolatum DSM 3385]|uniref:Phage integrase family protein n=1 Tax=Desulfocicer vacuolatum DSM 3385 TaxID=1121400 RepID=A0A1W2A3G4_9BACT|nr:site-specific integrase [Desulfocicer vacuolatum]SMC55200.1 Phage integrase family protein [Desulfocicer vacuolatum DSM 3385]